MRSGNQEEVVFFLVFFAASEERGALSETSSGGGLGKGGAASDVTLPASSAASSMSSKLTGSNVDKSSEGGAAFLGIKVADREEEDNVLRRLSRMGVVGSLEGTEDGDGVLKLFVPFFPSPHPSTSAAELVEDLSQRLVRWFGLPWPLWHHGFLGRRGLPRGRKSASSW